MKYLPVPLSLRLHSLSLPKLLRETALHIFSLPQQATLPLPTFFTISGRGFQPADAGGRIEPGVERQRNPRYMA